MKITLDCDKSLAEEEIVIKCREMNDTIVKILALASTTDKKLTGSIGKQVFVLDPQAVYYFESVDDKVFLYTKDNVYECVLRLYEIEQDFSVDGFIRANKSTIINLSKVKSILPLLNGKIQAELENGEKQIISRQYAPLLKQKLGIGGK